MRLAIPRSRICCPQVALFTLCLLAGTGSLHAASTAPQPRSQAEYCDHLKSLEALVAQCQQHTDSAHCSPDAVGPDDLVQAPNQNTPRRISYDWLRALLELAGNRTISPATNAPLLHAAMARLQLEESEAAGSPGLVPSAAPRTAERTALTAILHRAEFQRADRSLTQRILEAIAIWINRWLSRLVEYSAHRRWLALLLQWGLASLACVGLGYWCVRQARRARHLQPEEQAPVQDTPAMRNWERLRQDAEQAARQQHWRDAVRSYYWATIARFESRGFWPTDRARTPREYLRLVLPGNPRHDDLRRLTQCFETCWYGSETATQPDCETARLLSERLITDRLITDRVVTR
jgi:hypothetical protein